MNVQGPRAIWVWRQIEPILDAPPAFLDRLVCMRDPDHEMAVYLQVSKSKLGLASHRTRMAAFLVAAHQRDIVVHALGGDHSAWLSDPNNALDELLTPVLAFHQGRPAEECIDAIHVDIEPHQHDDWTETANEELLTELMAVLGLNKGASPLPVWADLPPWYFKSSSKVAVNGQPVGVQVADLGISVVLMSYRNKVQGSDGILGFSTDAIAALSVRPLPWRFGVNLKPSSVAKTTYAGSGMGAEGLFADLDQLWLSQPAGCAIHSWWSFENFAMPAPVFDPPAKSVAWMHWFGLAMTVVSLLLARLFGMDGDRFRYRLAAESFHMQNLGQGNSDHCKYLNWGPNEGEPQEG